MQDLERARLPPSAGALPPTQGRLQRYDAQLQLQVDGVDELSSATQQAMRITRSVGGTVSSVSYDAPSQGVGSAQLTLRVPVARVQQAIVQLSGLGTILSQRYGIEDLQPAADDLAQQIADTQARIVVASGVFTRTRPRHADPDSAARGRRARRRGSATASIAIAVRVAVVRAPDVG